MLAITVDQVNKRTVTKENKKLNTKQMATVINKAKNEILSTEVLLCRPNKDELFKDNYIMIRTDSFRGCKTEQLKELGEWLIKVANEFK